MIEIYFEIVFLLITIIWLSLMLYRTVKNRHFNTINEIKLLSLYICLIVIARITLFPYHLIDGHMQPLLFDKDRMVPFNKNLVPFVRMVHSYKSWKLNIIGNILMFIPVGIVWPLCFKKLDNIWQTVLAAAGYSFCIELIQLMFFERCTDIDDLFLNTIGGLIGAVIYFGIKDVIRKKCSKDSKC